VAVTFGGDTVKREIDVLIVFEEDRRWRPMSAAV
jgi:hypothetical protein